MNKKPYISIVIPIYDMPNSEYFLARLQDSLEKQTFRDFEIVVTKQGKMAENTNAGIKKARGKLIKILYQDDYLAHEQSLQEIVDNFTTGWLVTGCVHSTDGENLYNSHLPEWNENIHLVNTIGSPSVLTIENDNPLMFDEIMTWMLDADYYKRLYQRYGLPTFLHDMNVVIGIGEHQTTHTLSDHIKETEFNYMKKKYE
jgi:glycosyltransferase involved in cell wall biosynthesis